MVKMFMYEGNTVNGVRESMDLGIDETRDVVVVSDGVTVEVCGQKKNTVDVKLTGSANVNYGIANGELVIRLARKPGADTVPVARVYLPINVGIDRLDVSAVRADVQINSVVNRPFIKEANISVLRGNVNVSKRDYIENLNW